VSARQVITSSNLAEHLSHRARFNLWRELYAAQIGSLEFGIPEDRPFDVTLAAMPVGSLLYAKMTGTINRVARTARSIRSTCDDSFSFVINLSSTRIEGAYRGRQVGLAAGGAFLDGCEPQDFAGHASNSWINLQLPRTLLDQSFNGIDDRQGHAIAPDHPALGLMRNYLQIMDSTTLVPGSPLDDHCAQTILDLVGLATGAKGDDAELAGLRGVRAARLESILAEIRRNYRNPALSAALLGLQLGLSARYIQRLLATSGSGFSDRLLELRLQDARAMLSDPCSRSKKISDIALEVGFGDISNFNRCFRRRFGCSPIQAR
jgi:AraC-like DNA-binding protein